MTINRANQNWPEDVVIISPHAHELNNSGTACAEDCPACRWVDEEPEDEMERRTR